MKDLAIVIKKNELNQKLFHENYSLKGHQSIENSVPWLGWLKDRKTHRLTKEKVMDKYVVLGK